MCQSEISHALSEISHALSEIIHALSEKQIRRAQKNDSRPTATLGVRLGLQWPPRLTCHCHQEVSNTARTESMQYTKFRELIPWHILVFSEESVKPYADPALQLSGFPWHHCIVNFMTSVNECSLDQHQLSSYFCAGWFNGSSIDLLQTFSQSWLTVFFGVSRDFQGIRKNGTVLFMTFIIKFIISWNLNTLGREKLQGPRVGLPTFNCFEKRWKGQGARYNFLLEGAMGKPDEERSEPKPWRGSGGTGGTPLKEFETAFFRFA